MTGLFGSLSIGVKSLLANQAAIEVTSNNVANANTKGYSRQRALLTQEDPVQLGSLWFGTGVGVDRVTSVRDRILESRLDQETQALSGLDAYLGALRPVEATFNELEGGGVADALTRFFDALQALSTDPTSAPLRQELIAAGNALSTSFRRTAASLETSVASLDRSVRDAVGAINELTPKIAELNTRITQLKGTGQEAGALEDERQLLIRELAGLIDVSVIDSDSGLTVATAGGVAVVVGGESVAVQATTDAVTGRQHVVVGGVDLTGRLSGGTLSGVIAARDGIITSAASKLDQLAYDLATQFNLQHSSGFDLNGAAGQDFFGPPGSVPGAAAGFSVILTDASLIAASSDGSPGGNGNVLSLAGLREQAIVSGRKPADFYAELLVEVGNEVRNTSDEQNVRELILSQLQSQRDSISGVSLDEEAANLIRYQQAFAAAARVVGVINEMTEVAVNLGRN